MTQPFTIYVIQAAHTDIGYTHPQEQIALMYLEFYDQVLDLCRTTADAPEAQRFKWTCETAWQVRHYLTARPERTEEFVHYARTGQIEVTASYLHFTDMIDADAYRRSLQWVVDFCRTHAIPLRCAVHSDINGWPWAVADVLAEANIPYFCSQVHIECATDPLGKRGSAHYHWTQAWSETLLRPDVPIRIPQVFWWRGPSGGRVLHWLGEHYHLGNALGISSTHCFGADKTRYFLETDRLTSDELYQTARREVPRYIARLRQEGYRYDCLLLSTGGFYVDNAPPDMRWCELIARWNAQSSAIRLRTATLGEWFEALQARDEGRWPTYQVAWPDHWAHGLGSATARIAQARRSQRRRTSARTLVERSGSRQAAAFLTIAMDQELLALEHTFNAWSTTLRPDSALNHFQQIAKELAFHRTELYLDEAIGVALRALTPAPAEGARLYVDSADSPDRPRIVHFDAGDLTLDPAAQMLVAEDGRAYPFQPEGQDIPRFVAVLSPAPGDLAGFRVAPAALRSTTKASTSSRALVESAGWALRVDPLTGGLESLYERARAREWVASDRPYAFGQLVHEAVVHPDGWDAVCNPGRFVALGIAHENLIRRFADTPIYEHTTLRIDAAPQYRSGPVFDTIELMGAAERIGRVRIGWRLYHAIPLVELVLDWDKAWSSLPEAAYVAFPFAAADGRLAIEAGGGFFQPGSHDRGGQLPGTCANYYTIQRAAEISAVDGARMLWLPLDAPLVMPNAINYSNWETEPWVWNGFLASMPVNHYWHTNFAISQRGYIRLRYRLFSPEGLSLEAAIRTASPVDALGWRS